MVAAELAVCVAQETTGPQEKKPVPVAITSERYAVGQASDSVGLMCRDPLIPGLGHFVPFIFGSDVRTLMQPRALAFLFHLFCRPNIPKSLFPPHHVKVSATRRKKKKKLFFRAAPA